MYLIIENYLKRLRSIIIGVMIVSFLPSLFFGINQMVSMKPWEYSVQGHTYSLFPEIFGKFFYSMSIFLSSLLIGLFCSLLLTFISTLLPKTLQKIVYGFLIFLESLPDIFIIIVLQTSIVSIYQKTGILVGNVSNNSDDHTYLIPILVLSVLPTIQLFKITFLLMNDEKDKLYVNVARSMGLGNMYITLQHVFRNIIASLFHYSKTIFVFMLSNLLILEYVFNLHGIMIIMLHTQGIAFILTVLMIVLPFSILFEFAERSISNVSNHREEEAA